MSDDNTRISDRVPTTLRIRLRYADLDQFIERYAANISRGGIFIATRTPSPVGTEIKFEFQLTQGEPIIRGSGEVVWTRPFDPAEPRKPHGMGLRFTWLEPGSRGVIDRALSWKARKSPEALAAGAVKTVPQLDQLGSAPHAAHASYASSPTGAAATDWRDEPTQGGGSDATLAAGGVPVPVPVDVEATRRVRLDALEGDTPAAIEAVARAITSESPTRPVDLTQLARSAAEAPPAVAVGGRKPPPPPKPRGRKVAQAVTSLDGPDESTVVNPTRTFTLPPEEPSETAEGALPAPPAPPFAEPPAEREVTFEMEAEAESEEEAAEWAERQAAGERRKLEQAERRALERAATERAAAEQAAAEQATLERAATEQAATEQAALERAATEQAAAEQAARDEALRAATSAPLRLDDLTPAAAFATLGADEPTDTDRLAHKIAAPTAAGAALDALTIEAGLPPVDGVAAIDLDALARSFGLTPERVASTVEQLRRRPVATDEAALAALRAPVDTAPLALDEARRRLASQT